MKRSNLLSTDARLEFAFFTSVSQEKLTKKEGDDEFSEFGGYASKIDLVFVNIEGIYREVYEHVFAPRTATFLSKEHVQATYEAVFTEVFANVVEHEFTHRTLLKLEGMECCGAYDSKCVKENTRRDSFEPSSEQMQNAITETLNPAKTPCIIKCVGCGGTKKWFYPLDKPFFCKQCDDAVAGKGIRFRVIPKQQLPKKCEHD